MNDCCSRRVLVIGLDSAPPELVFHRWRANLPNISRLMETGAWAPLRSTVPPITVPAWAAMMTGLDPGTLGFYGFRNRRSYAYDALNIATSDAVTHPRVWDVLSQQGRRVAVLNVPQTYPPRKVNGLMISGFLTPDTTCNYTWPAELKAEIDAITGGYEIDVRGFRTENKATLLDDIHRITGKHFAAARHLLHTRPWDFFMTVEMGTDRIQHGFWKHFDPMHPKHDPASPYRDAIPDYYARLDREIGKLLAIAGPRTTVLVVSDHGAQPMLGCLCINEWLMAQGYLALKNAPASPRRLTPDDVDWSRTAAWAEGGYYSRVFLNVRGREPQGTILPTDYETLRTRLAAEIAQICDDKGVPLNSVVFRPEDVYSQVNNIAPDLIVYPGNLAWRSAGSIGLGSHITYDNDTGPDDANHGEYGIFVASGPGVPAAGGIEPLDIRDVAPTILRLLDCRPPVMQGKAAF